MKFKVEGDLKNKVKKNYYYYENEVMNKYAKLNYSTGQISSVLTL